MVELFLDLVGQEKGVAFHAAFYSFSSSELDVGEKLPWPFFSQLLCSL
jgi:hypothetical protein